MLCYINSWVVIVATVLCFLAPELVQCTSEQTYDRSSTGTRAVRSLKFVVVVSRHGNRGGNRDYGKDPYPLKDPKYWPYGRNQLTPRGREQMYNLGVKVRSLYNGFLNTTYYPSNVRASSTATDRTIMSGQVFLAGLYPPEGFQIWNKDIPWQPTVLYSNSPDNTEVINSCPKYVVDCNSGKHEFMRKYKANISEIIRQHNDATKVNNSNSEIWLLWDKLVSEDNEGYKLPDWTKELYPEPFKSLILKEYLAFYAGTDNIVRLIVGNLMGEVVEAMKDKTNGSLKECRLQYYSGHDATILALMSLLGLSESEIPFVKPSSALLLELHQDEVSKKFTVKMLFVDGDFLSSEVVSLRIPACGDPCDLETLADKTKRFTSVNFKRECQISNSTVEVEKPF